MIALLTAALISIQRIEVRMIETTRIELEQEGITEDMYNHSIIDRFGDRIYITDEEIALMERCVMSEAGGQSVDCQEAVATVILNRWQNPDKYPDNIIDVINDQDQFSTHDNGKPTVSVKLAVHNAIVYSNTYLMCIPYQTYWFRADHYHSFGMPYVSIDDLYFSVDEGAVLD